jgi:hypothetical protein
MREQGIRIIDDTETRQVRWRVVSARDCPDESAEQRIIHSSFPLPHAARGWPWAFVGPVVVRRTCRRVLLWQEAGILLEPSRSGVTRLSFGARPWQPPARSRHFRAVGAALYRKDGTP